MKSPFENEIKHKLVQRELTPSANAWERIQLQRKTRKNQRLYYLYFAASVIFIIGIFWILKPEARVTRSVASSIKPNMLDTKSVPHLIETPVFNPSTNQLKVAKNSKEINSVQIQIANQQIDLDTIGLKLNVPIETQKNVAMPSLKVIQPGTEIDYNNLDALLAKARQEIANGRGLSKPTNANHLLRDSEAELDANFRHSMLEYFFKQKKIKVVFNNN